jgi:putative redox protein
MSHPLSASATLIEGDHFSAATGSGGVIALAPAREDGAQPGAVSPMEALLVALVGCLGMSAAPFLRRQRPPIISYKISAHGVLSASTPRVFESIHVEHFITGAHLDRHAILRAIELAESRYCGVSAMLSEIVEITHTCVIAEQDDVVLPVGE